MATETVQRRGGFAAAGRQVARERFGGVDAPATLTGMLVALSVELLLGGLVAAAVGAFGFQLGFTQGATELSLGGAIAGFAVMFVAFLFGGWAAGRMARYDGARNGMMVAVWALLLAAILVALGLWLGDRYDVLARARLPQWATGGRVTAGAAIGGLVAVGVMLIGGALGGIWGASYHRRADRMVAEGVIAETIASETVPAATETDVAATETEPVPTETVEPTGKKTIRRPI